VREHREAVKRSPASVETPARQLAGFIGKFDPAVGRLIRSVRAALRKRLPTAVELVYDNYNFFVIGYCTGERVSDCIVSLGAHARGVVLSFYQGATLPDPQGLLQGEGKQNRFIRVTNAAMLRRPEVERLLRAAVEGAKSRLPRSRGYTVIKSVSAKQRPRRAAG